jgi:GNAT superfamily N-acetyltransferase
MTAVQPTRTDVRLAVPADRLAVTSVLAAAFHDDPIFCWIYPDPDRRAVANLRFFALAADALAHHDDTWTTGPGVRGAAMWVPYGRPAIPEDQEEAFTAALVELSGPDAERMLETLVLMEEHHPAEPHEYLWFLGVHPLAQGQGLGSALMAPVLDRADRAGVPTYLEATSERSKALYERHGFVAEAPIAVTGAPPMWPMWRRPGRG